MVVLVTTYVLHIGTETAMGTNLNILPRYEPNPNRHNT